MVTYRGPQKGKAIPLDISPEAARRFVVGLSWDPAVEQALEVKLPYFPKGDIAGAMAWVLLAPLRLVQIGFRRLFRPVLEADMRARSQRGKAADAAGLDLDSTAFDLDLSCYVFDADFNYLTYVGPENAAFIDESRKIYHSGEDQAGFGGPDDETISVETRDLPLHYHHFFFVVECDSGHSFEEIRNPAVRLADGKTDENALESTIDPPAHYNARGFAFCHVWREGDGFMLRNLDEYAGDNTDWPKFLSELTAGFKAS